MSLIKWRKREITTIICSLILVMLNAGIFYIIWEKNYTPLYYSQFYSIGKYAAVSVYIVLFIFSGRLYGAFWLKISRISEIIYANIVANVITGGLMYLVAWVFIRHLPNIFPMCFLIFLWTVTACLWVRPAIGIMNHYCAVERIAIIYEGDYQNGEMILKRVPWRFQLVGEVCADQSISDIIKKLNILSAEAVLICNISIEKRNEILKHCVLNNFLTYAQPNVNDYLIHSSKSVQVANMPFLYCQRVAGSGLYTFIKRILDIVLSVIGLMTTSPIMLVIAAIIKIQDKGPILVKHERVTLNRKKFYSYKFRCTRKDVLISDDQWEGTYTEEQLTPVGKFIRRWRLNELPRLFNVLKGDLAIVGPRADVFEEALQYEQEMPEYSLKYQVKAGLTGYVQIYGRYSANLAERLQMDLLYISQQSLAWDMKMILATIKVIFLPEGMDLILDDSVFTKEEKRMNCGQIET